MKMGDESPPDMVHPPVDLMKIYMENKVESGVILDNLQHCYYQLSDNDIFFENVLEDRYHSLKVRQTLLTIFIFCLIALIILGLSLYFVYSH